MTFKERDKTNKEIKEKIEVKPTAAFEFDTKNIKLANITSLEQIKGDKFKMTLVENNKEKQIESHVLGIVSYLDDIQKNVETTIKLMSLVTDKPKKIKQDEKRTEKEL